jgi:hypothetical protein
MSVGALTEWATADDFDLVAYGTTDSQVARHPVKIICQEAIPGGEELLCVTLLVEKQYELAKLKPKVRCGGRACDDDPDGGQVDAPLLVSTSRHIKRHRNPFWT